MYKRKYSLDILKFVATVIIVLHHFQQMTGAIFEGPFNFYKGVFYWGYLVEFFFVVSGYVTYRYSQQITQTSSFWEFWWKKYLRFLPMQIICCSVGLILSIIRNEGTLIFDFGTICTSFLGIQRWFSTKNMVNNPTWYISVLLLCYVVFFLVTYIAKQWKINPNTLYVVMIIFGVCMVTSCEKNGEAYAFFSKPIGRGYYAFFSGLLLKHILDTTRIKEKLTSIWVSILLIGAFIYLFVTNPSFIEKEYPYILTFVVYPALITLFEHEKTSTLFEGKWMKNLGGISFNAFMWHVSVINVVRIWAKRTGTSVKTQSVMVAVTVAVFIIGYFSYKLIESPISKAIANKRNTNRTTA